MSVHKSVRLFKKPMIDAKVLNQIYFVHLYDDKASTFVRGKAVKSIHIHDGRLVIDDLPVLKPDFGHDMITWKQQTKEHFTSGHLFFSRGGTELHGVVYRGGTGEDATAHHVLATTIAPVPYTTKITKKRYSEDTNPDTIKDDQWEDGLVLKVGYELVPDKEGDYVPAPTVFLDDKDITEAGIIWTIDPKTGNTRLEFSMDEDPNCDFDNSLYLTGSILFNILKPKPDLTGIISATCKDQDPEEKKVYFFKGQTDEEQSLVAETAPVDIRDEDLIEDDAGLSVAELMSIVPDNQVGTMANDMLVENMKWAMGRDKKEKKWLSELFGETPPAISPQQEELVKKSLDWYKNDFSLSYMGWAVANYGGTHAPSVNLSNSQKLKLKTHLQTGLAKSNDFTIQQNGIYINAFIEAKPKLLDYINDKNNHWAQELFAVITSPAQFTLMIARLYGVLDKKDEAMAPVNHFATLLTVLDPSGELASKYYEAVISGILTHSAHKTTAKDKNLIMEWLPEILQEFLNQAAVRGKVPDSAALAAKQLKEFKKENGDNMTTVASLLADFIVNANGSNIISKTKNGQTAFMKKYPKFKAIGRMLFFVAWICGIIFVIKAFMNWKNLSVEAKTKTILTTVILGFEALDVVPAFISGIMDMGRGGWNKLTGWLCKPKTLESVGKICSDIDENYIEIGATETTSLMDAGTSSVKTAGTIWADIFETVGGTCAKIVGVVGLVSSAVFAAFATVDFVKDIASGQPASKAVVDGLMAATNISMTVCLCLDLLVTTTVFAMAAALLAMAGVVISIIAMFAIKPQNPLDDFMKKTIIPFVKKLPEENAAPALAFT